MENSDHFQCSEYAWQTFLLQNECDDFKLFIKDASNQVENIPLSQKYLAKATSNLASIWKSIWILVVLDAVFVLFVIFIVSEVQRFRQSGSIKVIESKSLPT